MGIDPAARLAAANNAAWCAAVCRTHGLATKTTADVWWSAARTPPLFPDCVTLVPGAAPELLLAIIDSSAGCSVKDSFADLDLGPSGFTVVHEASWIARDTTAVATGAPLRWRRVDQGEGFDRWMKGWRAAYDAPADVLRPTLLSDPTVSALEADRDGELVAGAIVNDAASVLGVSNVFVVGEREDDGAADETVAAGNGADWAADAETRGVLDPWPSLVGYLVRQHRYRTIVGYESGHDLERAVAAGFRPAGPLRVWMRLGD